MVGAATPHSVKKSGGGHHVHEATKVLRHNKPCKPRKRCAQSTNFEPLQEYAESSGEEEEMEDE